MNHIVDLIATYHNAWFAALLIAATCSIVAVYVVMRRVAFIGIATSQIAAAGVALALLLHLAPLPSAAIATLLGVAFFSLGREPVRVSREALVGVSFAAASALSVLFVFRSATELDHIEHILYGSLLFATSAQVKILLLAAIVIVVVHALFAKEFIMISFDPDTAQTLGVRARAFDLLLFSTIGAVIALSISSAGSLLTFAFLILPALTALLLSQRLPRVFLISVLTGLLAAGLGMFSAILLDMPPGPVIVVTATILLLCAGLSRVRPWLGALAFALVLLPVTRMGAVHAGREQISKEDSAELEGGRAASSLHIDVELAVHEPRVKHGAKVTVDFTTRIPESARGEFHLLVNVDSSVESVRIHPGPRSGSLVVDTAGLAPGKHRVRGSVWTGPPLDPAQDTRMLDLNECGVNEVEIEILP